MAQKFILPAVLFFFLITPSIHAGKTSWWDQGSLAADSMPANVLYHLESMFSYQQIGGNSEGSVYSVTSRVVLRMNRFTNYNTYILTKQDITYPGDVKVDNESQLFQEDLRFDIFKWLHAGPGFSWYRNDEAYIKNRTTTYGGLGVEFPFFPGLTFTAFSAFGLEDIEYTVPSVPEKSSSGIFMRNSIVYYSKFGFILREKFAFLQYFEDGIDPRWDLDISADFKLAKYLYVQLGYSIKHEISKARPEENDTKLKAGFKISL